MIRALIILASLMAFGCTTADRVVYDIEHLPKRIAEAERCVAEFLDKPAPTKPPNIAVVVSGAIQVDRIPRAGMFVPRADLYVFPPDPPDWLVAHEAAHRIQDAPFLIEEENAKAVERKC